jgi:hypothetical protein
MQIVQQPLTAGQIDAVVRAIGAHSVNPRVYKSARGASLANVIDNTADAFVTRSLARKAERVAAEFDRLVRQHPSLRRYLPMSKMSRAEQKALAACKESFGKAGGYFGKAQSKYPDDDDVQNGHAHFVYGLGHLDKIIDFGDREPAGDLEDRDASEATAPAKKLSKLLRGDMRKTAMMEVKKNVDMHGRDLAQLVGTAVAKAAQAQPTNMNPARAESDVPNIPGRSVSFEDAGGDLSEVDNLARAGNTLAQSALIQRAMRPAVLAVRG